MGIHVPFAIWERAWSVHCAPELRLARSGPRKGFVMRARVVAVTPCGRPDAILCAAVSMAGALGVLDLGLGDRRALEQLALAADTVSGRPIGVRVAAGCNAS